MWLSRCVGFLIEEPEESRTLITAGHCIDAIPCSNIALVFDFAILGAGLDPEMDHIPADNVCRTTVVQYILCKVVQQFRNSCVHWVSSCEPHVHFGFRFRSSDWQRNLYGGAMQLVCVYSTVLCVYGGAMQLFCVYMEVWCNCFVCIQLFCVYMEVWCNCFVCIQLFCVYMEV